MDRLRLRIACCALLLSLQAGCATSPTGRSQLLLMSESELAQLGTSAFEEIKRKTPASNDVATKRYVRCVVDSIIGLLPGERPDSWEVQVFDDKAINAFALPGRKIGVYRGLLTLSENQHQLATVIGHEVAHNRAHHANERVSTSFVTESGLQLIQIATGANTQAQRQLFGLLGLGAQVGVLLPFSRAQEAEADLIGMDMMSTAGFDPRESVKLWQKMDAADQALPTAPLTWAERLKRVFDIDISVCPLCGGTLRLIADVTDPEVIQTILAHLKQRAPPGAAHRQTPRRAAQKDIFTAN